MFRRITALITGLLILMPLDCLADAYTVTKLARMSSYAWNPGIVSDNGRYALLGLSADVRDRMWSAKDGASSIAELFEPDSAPVGINNRGQIVAVGYFDKYDDVDPSRCVVELYTPGSGTKTILDLRYRPSSESFGQKCQARLNDRGHVIVAVTDRIDSNDLNLETPLDTTFYRYDGTQTAAFHRIEGSPWSIAINDFDRVLMTIGNSVRSFSANGKERPVHFPGMRKKYSYIQNFRNDGEALILSGKVYSGPRQRRSVDLGSLYGNDQQQYVFENSGRYSGSRYVEGRSEQALVADRKGAILDIDCLVPNSSRLSLYRSVKLLSNGAIFAEATDLDTDDGYFIRLDPSGGGSGDGYCVKSVSIRYGGRCEGLNTPGEGMQTPDQGTACTVEVTIKGPDGKPLGGADVRLIGDGNVYTGRTNGAGKAVIGFTYSFTDCYTVQAPYGDTNLRTESRDFPNCRYPV